MKTPAHMHVYAQHPRYGNMAYCTICGFAVIKAALVSAGLWKDDSDGLGMAGGSGR
jgi:hypothetical protein